MIGVSLALTDLPNEIYYLLFKYLDFEDLLNLSLTCTQFHRFSNDDTFLSILTQTKDPFLTRINNEGWIKSLRRFQSLNTPNCGKSFDVGYYHFPLSFNCNLYKEHKLEEIHYQLPLLNIDTDVDLSVDSGGTDIDQSVQPFIEEDNKAGNLKIRFISKLKLDLKLKESALKQQNYFIKDEILDGRRVIKVKYLAPSLSLSSSSSDHKLNINDLNTDINEWEAIIKVQSKHIYFMDMSINEHFIFILGETTTHFVSSIYTLHLYVLLKKTGQLIGKIRNLMVYTDLDMVATKTTNPKMCVNSTHLFVSFLKKSRFIPLFNLLSTLDKSCNFIDINNYPNNMSKELIDLCRFNSNIDVISSNRGTGGSLDITTLTPTYDDIKTWNILKEYENRPINYLKITSDERFLIGQYKEEETTDINNRLYDDCHDITLTRFKDARGNSHLSGIMKYGYCIYDFGKRKKYDINFYIH